jgi:hypothetical protein
MDAEHRRICTVTPSAARQLSEENYFDPSVNLRVVLKLSGWREIVAGPGDWIAGAVQGGFQNVLAVNVAFSNETQLLPDFTEFIPLRYPATVR